jgi:hypothetical protein
MSTPEGESIGSSIGRDTAKKRGWNWVLWWRVDEAELEEQVAGYESLGFWRAARKLSAGCLFISVVATAALISLGRFDNWAYLDMALIGILAVFIYFGHRWAMIGAMVIWTLEKALAVAGASGPIPGAPVVAAFFWWTAYMHAFYLAFRTEQRRRSLKNTAVAVEVF